MRTVIQCCVIFILAATTLKAQIPSSNLKLHLKADAGTSTTTDGAALSSWADQSGNGNNASAPESQPVFKTNVVNGKPAVRFDGSSSYLALPTPSSMGIQNSNYELFIVARSSSASIQFLMGGNVAENEMHLNGSSGTRYIPKNPVFLDHGTDGQYTNGAFHIFHPVTSDTGAMVRVDAQDGGGSGGDHRSSDNGAVRLGLRGDGSYALNGDIAEVIIYNTVLPQSSRDSVLSYLANKYTITSGNLLPYLKPTVTIKTASNVASSSATLRGTVNPNGTAASYSFKYGTSVNDLSSTTSTISAGSGTSPVNVTAGITGLTTNTMYYYTLVGTSSAGTSVSDTISFYFENSIPYDNMKLWLRAGVGTTSHTAGTTMSVWGDISGNGNDAVTMNSTVYQTNIMNGQPVVRFNGSNSNVVLPTAAQLGIQNSEYEVLIVARSQNSGVQFLFAGAFAEYEMHLNGLGGLRFITGAGPSLNAGSHQQFVNGNPAVFAVRASALGAAARVNGENLASTTDNSLNDDGNAMYLGMRGDNTYYLDGDIAEVMIFDTILTASRRREWEDLLAARYGVSILSKPTVQTSGLTITNVDTSSLELNFTAGNGTSRIVLLKEGSAVNAFPADEAAYSADAAFGSGTPIGTGNYVVYNGTGNSVTVTGLTPGITYHVAVMEYNGSSDNQLYRTTSPLTGEQRTLYRSSVVALLPFTAVTAVSATAHGLVNPGGNAATYRFAYGTNPAALSDTTAPQSVGNGIVDSTVSASLSGLTPATLYYVRLLSNSIAGTVVSPLGSVVLDTTIMNLQPALWLRADNAGASNNDAVQSWYDLSQNGHHAVQTAPADRPAFLTNTLNGKPVVRFNGTSSHLVLPTAGSLGLTLHDYEVYIVTRSSSSAEQYVLSGPSSATYEMSLNSSGSGAVFYPGVSSMAVGAPQAYTDGNPHLFALKASAAGGGMIVNGNDRASNGNNLHISTDGELLLGRSAAAGSYLDGDIAEVLIFGSVLTLAERQQLSASLSQRYGIDFAFEPMIAPVAVTFSNVDTVSMKITATKGNGSGRMIVVRQGSAVTASPADEVTYSANAEFGAGAEIGTGNFVVYNGSDSSVTLTGLNAGTTYHVAVFEYSGGAGSENYFLTSATGSRMSKTVAPHVMIAAVTGRATVSPTANGTVNPREIASTYRFAYGTNPSALSDTTSPQSAGSGTDNVSVSASLTGLTNGSYYYVRLLAYNAGSAMAVSDAVSFLYDTVITNPSLKLWLRADNAGTSDNDNVGLWQDLSGNGNNATQTNGPEIPTYQSNVMNGKPVVRFNGAQSLNLPIPSTLGIQNSPFEMIIVGRSSATGVQFLIGGTAGSYEMHLNGASGMRFIPVSPSYLDAGSDGQYADGNGHIFTGRTSATYGTNRVDGENHGSVVANTTNSDDGQLYLGKRGNGTYYLTGDIAEVLIYNNPLTADERRSVEASLAQRYGVTIANTDEPSVQASNVTFSNIDSNSYTVTVTKGNGANRLIVMKQGTAVDGSPTDEITYTANAVFGTGTEIGSGNFVVYNGSDSVVTVTGLAHSTTYHVAVYEYNGSAGNQNYTGSSTATGNRATVTPKPDIALLAVTNTGTTSVTVNGMVNSRGSSTSVRVAYGTNAAALSDTTSAVSAGSSTETVNVSRVLSNLTHGTRYHYRLLAANSGGMSVSPVMSFAVDTAVITEHLTFWLRAENAGTSNDDPVTTWSEYSGKALDAVQGGPSAPTFQSNSINGKPVVRFNGSSSVLQLPLTDSLGLINSEYEMLFVARSSSSAVQYLLSTPAVQNLYELQYNSGSGLRYVPVNGTVLEAGAVNSVTDGDPRIFSVRASAASTLLRMNGVNVHSIDTDVRSGQSTNLTLGVRKSEDMYYFDGDVADVIIYDTVLTTAQRKEAEAALAQRYGITLFAGPTVQAGAVTFSQIDSGSMKVTVVKGNGTGRMIVAKQGSAVDASFNDEQSFTANAQFGSGSEIGTGNFVVYTGTDSVVTVTGLLTATVYHFAVYEYNGPFASALYLHASPAAASETTTVGRPAVEIQNPGNYTSTTVTLNGRVMPMGGATTYRFVYGTDPNALSDTTDAVSAGSGTEAVSVNSVVSGLTSGALYHVRILATSPGGTVVSTGKTKFVYDSAVVRSNLRVWLRADNYEGAANSSVMQWDDLTLNGNNAWGSWSPSQPTFQLNSINGKPAMNFDGNNQELYLPTLSQMGIYESDYEIVIVASSTSSDIQFLFSSGTPGIELHLNGGTQGARFLNNFNLVDGGGQAEYSNGVPQLFTMRGTINGGALRINGINNGTSDQYFRPFFDYNLRIGRRGSTEYPLTGKIAEIMIFNSPLTPDQRKHLEASLAERYGMTVLKAPTLSSSTLAFSNVDTGSVKVTVTKGNGAQRIILAKLGSAVDAYPADDVTYTANAGFGAGSMIGTGNYVVYNGSDSVVTVTGMNGSTEYHFAAFEYNGQAGNERYRQTLPAAGAQQTNAGLPLVTPPDPTNITATSATLHGTVNPRGGMTTVRFAYGLNPNALSDTTAPQSAGNGTSSVPVSASISALTQGQLYFVRLIAANSGGTAVSAARTVFSDTASITRTNLKVWLRADKGIDSVNAVVSTWYDLSGSFNNAQQTDPGARPIVIDSSMNDRPVVRFNGSTARMMLPTAAAIGLQNSPYEIFIVARSFNTYSAQTLLYGTDTTYSMGVNFGTGLKFNANTNANPSIGTYFQYTNAYPYLFHARAGTDAGKVKVNGFSGTPVAGSQLTADNPALTIGGRWYGGWMLNGDIAEMLIYDSVMTPEDRRVVETYLSSKYGTGIWQMNEPTVQASNVSISAVTDNAMTVTVNKGNGIARLVVVKKGSPADAVIEDEMYIAPNAALGTANRIDSVNYAVYGGSDSVVTVTGLDGSSTYHVAVYEYNVYQNDENYLLTSPARGSATTLIAPPAVSIAAVSDISGSGARLNANVNPKNHSTAYRFAFGTNPAALTDSTAVTVLSAVDSSVAVTAQLTGLTANTAYFARVVAVNIGGTTVSDIMSFVYDPAMVRTNMRLWLSAESGTGDTLSSWYDLTGLNHHATTASANKPVRVASVSNNKPAVRFNGTPSLMKLPAASTLGIQNSDYELFIVARSASSDIQFLMGGEVSHYEMHLNGASGLRFIPTGSAIADKGTSGGFTDNDLHIFSGRATASEAFSRIDTSDGDAVSGNGQSASAQPIYLGMRSDGSYVLNGEIAEVIIYNAVLTPEARDSVETYLKNKYLINALLPMTYTSSAGAHTDSTRAIAGSANNTILRIAVDVVGSLTPFGVTSFTLNTAGSTDAADISKAKIFYTGKSSVFSTAVQFGSDYSAPNGAFTITGSQQLVGGRNYFWLTYDVPLTAAHRDTLDAQVTSVTVNGTPRTPAVTSPAGRRVISNVPAPTAWLKAEAGTSSTTAGDPVTQWLDQSGNGFNAGQGNESYAPYYYPNVINGKPVLRFNGSTSRIYTDNASSMGLQNSDFEYFVVAKTTSQDVQFLVAGWEVNMYELHLNGSSGARGIFADGMYADLGATGTFADGAPHIFNARATDTYGMVRIDAVDGPSVSGNGRSSNPYSLAIGVRADGQYSFNGDVAEMMIYNRVLSNSERSAVEEYLKEKYAVYSGALPVELVSFTASSKLLNAELQWKTATEVNNHGFEVERREVHHRAIGSSDQTSDTSKKQWNSVSFVEGHGTSNVSNEYSFIDKNLKAGKYSYRLKQIDRDGKFSYSQEIEVEVGSVPLVFALDQNYPNPFNPGTTIGFTLSESGPVTLKVYDMLGREVAMLVNDYREAGVYHQTMFDASRFASGIYFARLTSAGKTQIRKMMLMK